MEYNWLELSKSVRDSIELVWNWSETVSGEFQLVIIHMQSW